MHNNIYKIMEDMQIVRYDIELKTQLESLQYITEGDNIISKTIEFIKNIIKKFVDFVKNIISRFRGGGGGSDSSDEGSKSSNTRKIGMVIGGDRILIYPGLMQLSKLYQNFSEHSDMLIEAKEDFDEYCKDKSSQSKIMEYYYYSMGVRGEYTKDGLSKLVLKINNMDKPEEYGLDVYKVDVVDDFIDNQSDRLLDAFDDIARREKDKAQKLINQIKDEENFDKNEVTNLNCYIVAMSHLIIAYNVLFKRIYSSHNAISKTLQKYNKIEKE